MDPSKNTYFLGNEINLNIIRGYLATNGFRFELSSDGYEIISALDQSSDKELPAGNFGEDCVLNVNLAVKHGRKLDDLLRKADLDKIKEVFKVE